jgi:2-oxoglutarate dehydrogenase E2 component (dihydrolipoamide succinyltransferase)
MAEDIVVPELGESISEGTVARWLVEVGDAVEEDAPLVELETDKASVEIPAPASGVLKEIRVEAGDDVPVGAVLGIIDTAAKPEARGPETRPVDEAKAKPEEKRWLGDGADEETPAAEARARGDGEKGGAEPAKKPAPARPRAGGGEERAEPPTAPSVRRLMQEHGVDAAEVRGTGPRGRILREDVERHLDAAEARGREAPSTNGGPAGRRAPPPMEAPSDRGRATRRVPMTRLRRTIARRLKEAQNEAAILTTFNEVDLSTVMNLRRTHGEAFRNAHGVKLGIMSFFTKACVEALKAFPALNGYIDGDEIVYHDYYDIGVAVSTERGLVVPVLRDVDRMSFAEIEKRIAELAVDAREGRLTLDLLSGGTFSITNGGIFGSMLSTPILNPPQSGILGLHAITDRPVAVNGQVEIRPMMYLAVSYDHRLVDGSEAVRFLVKIKDVLEEPSRLMLEV